MKKASMYKQDNRYWKAYKAFRWVACHTFLHRPKERWSRTLDDKGHYQFKFEGVYCSNCNKLLAKEVQT